MVYPLYYIVAYQGNLTHLVLTNQMKAPHLS
nr:MAG TPA: hypothetical protein [Bacteriophage sp.]